MSSLRYLRALLHAAPLGEVARTALRRTLDPPRWRRPAAVSGRDALHAARGLVERPRLFPVAGAEAAAVYDEALPGARDEALRRARRILGGELELFGAWYTVGATPAWHVDPRDGRRFDATVPVADIDLTSAGPDPRGPWELARAQHLLELGFAARLWPDLADRARRRIGDEIDSFLDENPLGFGIHWTSPLEAALRSLHWIAALELVGGDLGPDLLRRLGIALVEHGRYIEANLEDRGVVPANHLIADLVGLLAIGVAVGDAAEASAWRSRAVAGLAAEAARQVLPDGAAFEASTGYHRFTLELLLAADRVATAAGLPLALGETLGRMFRFVAGYVGPDGDEPGFGDGDDGRVLPVTARAPRRHDYLLPVGVVRSGDAALRLEGVGFSEEAAWLGGSDGWQRFRALPAVSRAGTARFDDGGLHVLRGGRDQVAMRCGGYGQHGVGGHAHNDQLAVAVWLDGAPLVIDPGTLCYAADPAWRNHFRGTGAHATVTVDGEEQSPLFDGRLFALPDRAHARCLAVEDIGEAARVVGRHVGYTRLPSAAVHEREVLLDRVARAVVVTDRVDGSGAAAVTVRFPLPDTVDAVRALEATLAERVRARLDGVAWASEVRLERAVAVWRRGRPFAALVPLGDGPAPAVEAAWWSPRYGERRRGALVSFEQRATLPLTHGLVLLRLDGADEMNEGDHDE